MQRDDFTCQLCKDAASPLHVHHKSYTLGAEPWEYEDENFITYCSFCHRIVEDIKKSEGFSEVVSVKKMYNIDGSINSILVSFIQDHLVYVAAYLCDPISKEAKHIVTIVGETIDVIHDLREQAELSTLR